MNAGWKDEKDLMNVIVIDISRCNNNNNIINNTNNNNKNYDVMDYQTTTRTMFKVIFVR